MDTFLFYSSVFTPLDTGDFGDRSCTHHCTRGLLLIYSVNMRCSAISHYVAIALIISSQRSLEKTASLLKNDNWLLCFNSSLCCCSLISMFSLFCCAPDTNENVLWDLNQFWVNNLLHWFITSAVIYFSPASFLDWVRTAMLGAKMLF